MFIYHHEPERLQELIWSATSFFKFKFFFLWLCWVFIAVQAFLQLRRARGTLQLQWMAFSLQWLLLLWSTDSRHSGFSSCGPQALEHAGLPAPWQVESLEQESNPCLLNQLVDSTSELPGQPQLPHFTSEDCASREVTSLTQGHIITNPKILNFPTMVLQSTPPPQYLQVLFYMQRRYHLWPQLPLDPRNTFI